LALSEVPLLEVVGTVLLVTGVDLGEVNHLAAKLNLGETFVHEQVVLLMHGAVATLAGTGEDLEASAESTAS
jgi:hypothetical protein